jgi:Tfp pilus assembly protein PilV
MRTARQGKGPRNQVGFGLIEATMASAILVVGLAALAGLFGQSLTFLLYTREDLIAKQKAREALESVYSARNDATVGFAGIQNTNNGGIFTERISAAVPGWAKRDCRNSRAIWRAGPRNTSRERRHSGHRGRCDRAAE